MTFTVTVWRRCGLHNVWFGSAHGLNEPSSSSLAYFPNRSRFLFLVRVEMASPPWCSSSSSGCFRRTSRRWCHTPGWCPATVETHGVSYKKGAAREGRPGCICCSPWLLCSRPWWWSWTSPAPPCPCAHAHTHTHANMRKTWTAETGGFKTKQRSGCKANAEGRFCMGGCLREGRRCSPVAELITHPVWPALRNTPKQSRAAEQMAPLTRLAVSLSSRPHRWSLL